MRVIVVNDHLQPDGGADVAALASARALVEAGLDVTLFAADTAGPDAAAAAGLGRVVSTGQPDLARGRPARVALQGLWNSEAARRLRALVAEHDASRTVVHVHSWTKALSSSVFGAAAGSGARVVLTLHEYFSVCPSGLFYNAQTQATCPLQPMSARCIATHCDTRRYAHKLYRVLRHGVQTHLGGLARHVDHYVAISRLSQRIASPHLPPGAAFTQVPNPIEIGSRQAGADPAACRPFVMVARVFAPKGWDLFLEACRRAGVPALCVGDGPDRAALQAAYPEARFTGQLGRDGVVAAMRSARALVLASRWYESQGMVIAEAAAHGVPAIASDTCGGAEAIEPGVNGLVFASGDVAQLASHLRRLADDDALVRRMGQAAHERFWADPPDRARHARGLLGVYERVLAAGSHRAAAGRADAVEEH